MTDKAFQRLDKYVHLVSKTLNFIGVSVLMLMMFLVATDVCLRYVFNSPIEGVYEAIELMMAVVFCYGIAYTQRHKGHVSVNLLVTRLSEKTRAIINSCVYLITAVVFVLITWQSFEKANITLANGETTYGGVGPFGHIAIFPFVYLTSVACLAFCLEILVDLIDSIKKVMPR